MARTRFSTRRGRPRATARITPDKGTPELVRKREQSLTSETIDLCYQRGLISEQEHHAALHFRWLYTLRFGVPTVQALDIDKSHRGGAMPESEPACWRTARNQEYRQLAQLLEARHLLVAVLRVAVFDDPAPLRQDTPAGKDCLQRLQKGLALLAGYRHCHPVTCFDIA